MRFKISFALNVLLFSVSALAGGHQAAPARSLPDYFWGVTTDAVSKINDITTALRSFSKMPVTRIVFDENVPAKEYSTAAQKISGVSYVMGELLDSYYVKSYSLQKYKDRANEYMNLLGNQVDLWEVGNEVNGEWLGTAATVVPKIAAAYDIAKEKGMRTAMTLYYNQDCWEKKGNEMFTWAQANVPERMKQGLDYVFISYYEDDCNGLQPKWQEVFDRLGEMFPNSKIGIGESGTKKALSKATYINRYYRMNVNHPRFVGGYFWWYFRQDMVPMTKPLWSVLQSTMVP